MLCRNGLALTQYIKPPVFMRRAIALVVIMTVIVLIAHFTKPSKEQCIKEATAQYQKVVSNAVQTLPGNISKELLQATMQKAFKESLQVKDNIVYQQIYLQKDGERNTIGWGAFGMVQINLK